MIFESKIKQAYCSRLHSRVDDTGTVFYFSEADFPGLNKAPFSFSGAWGQRLQGYFYWYDAPKADRLMIFDHGMGGGHRAYMKEIERLAKRGFLVYSYDHTGCMESEGTGCNGLAQSLSDLDCCLSALKEHAELRHRNRSVLGHSWGAYATLNVLQFHRDLTHAVAMSGFISAEQMLNQRFRGWLTPYRAKVKAWEEAANPKYYPCSAVDSLQTTETKVLVIHSDDDRTVRFSDHFDQLKSRVSGNEHVTFLPITGKGHNPSYTEDAVAYKRAFFRKLRKTEKHLSTKEEKEAFLAQFDWDRMTRQDDGLWKIIFDHLDR